jgi:alkylation response protein AidB-like acyl-CoA dehydrogenase
MAVDFSLSPEQRDLQKAAREFAANVLAPAAAKRASLTGAAESFYATRDAYREMARAGFVKAMLPKELGGGGLPLVDFAIAAEELTSVDVNVPTTVLGTGLGLQPILLFGTAEQKKRLCTDFVNDADGDLLASFAFTDLGGGANYDSEDPNAGVQTFARRDGDSWVVRGDKHYTTNGSGWDGKGAHLFTVVCRTDPSQGASRSLAVIAVPGAARGIEVVDVYEKMGHRGVMTPRVRFDDVRVPADNLIGKPGDGVAIVGRTFSWTAALIGAACVGTMRRAFEIALDFAKREKRLGSNPVIDHQAVGFLLADAKMKIEAVRYLTWKACHELDTGGDEELAIMTKVFGSETAVQVIYDCMRVVGVESYTDKTPLERLLRDALVFPLYDGGNVGVRRRQLHELFRAPGYDPRRAAAGVIE